MNKYLIGVDIGTSGTKSILIDDKGNVKARALIEYPLYTPKPLWAEQNPADWWNATCGTIKQLIEKTGVSTSEIVGVGLSGQMHGSVFLDANNQVIRPALLWCDQRTAKECEWITNTVGKDKIIELTSNPVLTGFTAGKIIWLRNNEPENYAKIKKVLLPKDYIRFMLTGEYATEVSDASGTSLFNVIKRDWAYEVLDAINLPREWMAKVYESPEISGRISEEASQLTELAVGTPVVGGGGDQAAGAVGNGIVETGVVSSSVGTSGVVFAFLDTPAVDPKLRTHTFCHAVPGKWHVMGVMLSAGGSLRWYRDTFCEKEKELALEQNIDPYELITASANKIPVGCDGLIFLPYLTGERTPYPDPYARGVFFGATLAHNKAHFSRSVLEGVSYGLKDSFTILEQMGVPMTQVRVSGGGAKSPIWRQIMADIIGKEHVTINVDEGPALGVALLAGVGTGIWKDVPTACKETIQVSTSTKPNAELSVAYSDHYAIYQKLYSDLKERFSDIAKL